MLEIVISILEKKRQQSMVFVTTTFATKETRAFLCNSRPLRDSGREEEALFYISYPLLPVRKESLPGSVFT